MVYDSVCPVQGTPIDYNQNTDCTRSGANDAQHFWESRGTSPRIITRQIEKIRYGMLDALGRCLDGRRELMYSSKKAR